MTLPPEESLSKDEIVLICVHCISGTCVHEHISPLLGEHPSIVNIYILLLRNLLVLKVAVMSSKYKKDIYCTINC